MDSSLLATVAMYRNISSTMGAIAVAACLIILDAPLRGAQDEPAANKDDANASAGLAAELKPQHEDSQALFRTWQANARLDGKIPGALIGNLGSKVEYFISLNEGLDLSAKFEQLLPRFDATVDWTKSDAVALLDDTAAIHRIPLLTTLAAAEEAIIHSGLPLPAELKDAAWGQAAPSGLRAAWLLEPRAKWHRLGTSLKSRILVHNSGQQAVIFAMPSWQQTSEHSAHDANGATINVTSTYWTTLARKTTYRLAPGEYCESPAPGIGVGTKAEDEDWANVRVGAWIDAKTRDEVRLSPGAVKVSVRRIFDENPVMKEPTSAADLWKRIVAERVGRELPLPDSAAERAQLLRRVSLDLFGLPPTPEELAAFVTDDAPTVREALEKRLLEKPGFTPHMGTLQPGEIRFRVLPADPDAANRPRVATGPGYYILGDHQRLQVQRSIDGDRRTNKATIRFFASKPKTDPPGKPYDIALPDGLYSYAIAWDRDSGVLWVSQKGLARSYDFTNPAEVKETRLGPDEVVNLPKRFKEAIETAQQEEPLEPNNGG